MGPGGRLGGGGIGEVGVGMLNDEAQLLSFFSCPIQVPEPQDGAAHI